jgi:hypothetical protein
VLPADQEVEPAPIRDPVGVHGFPWEWVFPAVVAALPLIALIAWWLYRRRTAAAAADPSSLVPPLAQLEELLRQLEAAVGREPSEGVCDRLAWGFRRYLERRSGEPALEMTSYELRGLARRSRWPDGTQRSLHEVMQVVDGVRFGRRRVPEAQLRGAIGAAEIAGRGLEEHLTQPDNPEETAP